MRPCHTLVHAALIVTQDEERTVLENASMAVLDGLVADIGPRHEVASRWQPQQEVDLGQCVLLPGLVNAHTHAGMSLLRGYSDDEPLEYELALNKFLCGLPLERPLPPRAPADLRPLAPLVRQLPLSAGRCLAG